MSVLGKPLDAVTIADLDELIASGASETGELEFVGTLPGRAETGEPGPPDGSIETGDLVGDDARDEILSAMIAFANADGGTLILGLHETNDQPPQAERLEPLPDCDALARQLLDAADSVVEPRLVGLDARALPAAEDGAGYVVLRVGKSPLAPHRLQTTGEFYVRRGERTSKLAADEINDRMLDLARMASHIEETFQERRAVAKSVFHDLPQPKSNTELARLLVRGAAFPTTPLACEGIVSPKEAWWRGGEFTMMAGGQTHECPYPARAFASVPLVGLRSLSRIDENSRLRRLITDDGLVEFAFSNEPAERRQIHRPRLYVAWAVGVFVGVVAQVQHLRTATASDAVDFGVEFEVWSDGPLQLRWKDDHRSPGEQAVLDEALPLRLTGYRIGRPDEFDELLTLFVSDLHGAWGIEFDDPCSVPWRELF